MELIWSLIQVQRLDDLGHFERVDLVVIRPVLERDHQHVGAAQCIDLAATDLRIGFGRIKHASLTIVGEMGAGFRVANPVGVFS